jgi:hypothetical protein
MSAKVRTFFIFPTFAFQHHHFLQYRQFQPKIQIFPPRQQSSFGQKRAEQAGLARSEGIAIRA